MPGSEPVSCANYFHKSISIIGNANSYAFSLPLTYPMSDASRPSLAAASLRPNPRGGRAGFRLRLQPVMNGCFQADASRGQVSFSLASFAGRTVFPVEIDPFLKPSCFPAHLHLPSGTCGAAVCGHVESVRQTAAMQQKMYSTGSKTENKSVPG